MEVKWYENNEHDFRNRIAGRLSELGWRVSTERPVPTGRIDILAFRDDCIAIIEVKVGSSCREIQTALGQLLWYSEFYPNALLQLATPKKPAQEHLEFLKRHGVEYLDPHVL